MEGAVIFDVEEGEREQRGALSFIADNPSLFVIFVPSCRLALFLLFVVLSNQSFFIPSFCYSLLSFSS